MLGFFLLRVANGYDEIDWHFMTVGHTKFKQDEGFGNIRRFIGSHATFFKMRELFDAINALASSNRCVIFPLTEVVDFKSGMNSLKPLSGKKKHSTHKLYVRAVMAAIDVMSRLMCIAL